MDTKLRAIAEPHRRAILRLVQAREMTSGHIAAHFDLTGPAISQHLKVLEAAGLVTVRKSGTRRLYRAERHALADLQRFLKGFWADRLDAMATEAEAEERRQKGAGTN